MAVFRITGGRKLHGDLYPQGAKNEALQILSAVLLTKEAVVVKNVPKIRDVMNLIELLMSLGVKVTQLKSNDYKFQADDVNLDYLTSKEFQEKSKTLRGCLFRTSLTILQNIIRRSVPFRVTTFLISLILCIYMLSVMLKIICFFNFRKCHFSF